MSAARTAAGRVSARHEPATGGRAGGVGGPGAVAADRPGPQPVSELLEDYLQASGLAASLDRMGALAEWESAVGPQISRVTRPIEVRGDVLVVEVSSSAWMNELSMMRPLILEQVNAARAGRAIGGIRFRAEGTEPRGRGRGPRR